MATLEIQYARGIKVWEEDARGGISLEVDPALVNDPLGNPRASDEVCAYFGRARISESYASLPNDMADWWPVIAEAEGVTQVKLNGSVIWLIAQAEGLAEIMSETNPMIDDFDDDGDDGEW